jgi:hypothetical protein
MCDDITMPDGTIYNSIYGGESCLCGATQEEIILFIFLKLGKIEFDERITIDRDCFGWYVGREKLDYSGNVVKKGE